MASEERRLVLVVDTDERFIDEARSLLADERVVTARNLDEAVEITLGGRVDLVLLGPAFGSEIALDQARRLLDADSSAQVAVVADAVTNRLLKTALKEGFADVLAMPLSPADIAEVVRSVSQQAPGAVEVVMEPASGHGRLLPIEVDSGPVADPHSDSPVPDDAIGSVGTIAEMTFAPAEPRLIDVPAPREAALGFDQAVPDAQAPHPVTPPASSVVAAPVVPDSSIPPAALFGERDALPPLLEEPARSPAALPPAPPPPPDMPPPIPAAGDLAEAAVATPRPGGGQVIAVTAGKGGSGKSVVATNLAIALGMRGDPERVAIVDADLQFGDVALLLGLDPVRTLDDVVGEIDSMSDERMEAALLRHESGVRVLAAPLLPVRAGEIDAKDVVAVVQRLRPMYDVVVVDTGSVFDDGLITILEHADQVITVVDMDLPSVKNAKVALDGLRRAGFDTDRIRLVVNRANSKARLDLVEVERSLRLRVGGTIPSDRLIPQSVNEGVPVLTLSPRSRAARAFHSLAESVAPDAARERLADQ